MFVQVLRQAEPLQLTAIHVEPHQIDVFLGFHHHLNLAVDDGALQQFYVVGAQPLEADVHHAALTCQQVDDAHVVLAASALAFSGTEHQPVLVYLGVFQRPVLHLELSAHHARLAASRVERHHAVSPPLAGEQRVVHAVLQHIVIIAQLPVYGQRVGFQQFQVSAVEVLHEDVFTAFGVLTESHGHGPDVVQRYHVPSGVVTVVGIFHTSSHLRPRLAPCQRQNEADSYNNITKVSFHYHSFLD